MKRKYNWTSAVLLAALILALSFPAVETWAAVVHIQGGGVHEVVAEASSEPGTLAPAFVSTQEAGLDAIFSQASFGLNPIDIIFESVVELVNPSFLNLNTSALTLAILGTDIVSSPGVNMFFVDTIDHCGGFNVNIVGCAFQPGNNLVVESVFASGGNGPELLAHELGHNLGLPHITAANLMTGTINGNTNLTSVQATTIRNSPLVQGILGSEFIRITPILVVATATVPEPASSALLLSGIVFCTCLRRRKSKIRT